MALDEIGWKNQGCIVAESGLRRRMREFELVCALSRRVTIGRLLARS
jgi:hypothetical protein